MAPASKRQRRRRDELAIVLIVGLQAISKSLQSLGDQILVQKDGSAYLHPVTRCRIGLPLDNVE